MILDRSGLRLLLDLSERVEEVSDKSSFVRDTIRDPEDHTPEDRTLEGIVSDLGRVQDRIRSLISRYPEDVVREEIERGGYSTPIPPGSSTGNNL